MDLPITKIAHSKISAEKHPYYPTCEKPIGENCSCSSGYIHVRNGGK